MHKTLEKLTEQLREAEQQRKWAEFSYLYAQGRNTETVLFQQKKLAELTEKVAGLKFTIQQAKATARRNGTRLLTAENLLSCILSFPVSK